jgi:hypothetical protein
MPPEIYERVVRDADTIGDIRYASANFLRMNMYLELSRPAGDVSRWEKVYTRLLLLNDAVPLRAGRCTDDPLGALASAGASDATLHDRIVGIGMAANAIFLSGIPYLQDAAPRPDEVVLMIAEKPTALIADLKTAGLRVTTFPAMGELLPARTELRTARRNLVAVVFDSVACHAYTTLDVPVGYRLASLDLLIQMYYAFYFADLQGYLPVRLLCVIQELIEMEITRRRKAAVAKEPQPRTVFPLECTGHQPTLPELKKAHRERVQEKRKELIGALRPASGVRATRKKQRRH